MYNDQLVYKVVIWAFFGIRLWIEKVALRVTSGIMPGLHVLLWKYQLNKYGLNKV